MDNGSTTSGGVGFFGLLTIVFITLKLTGYITWSWLWVLSPFWIPLCLFLVIFIGVLLAAIISESLKKKGL